MPKGSPIVEFFSSLEKALAAYNRHSTLSFYAVKERGKFVLVKARVSMNVVPPDYSLGHVRTRNIIAGAFNISAIKTSAADIASGLLDGVIETPLGRVTFLPRSTEAGYEAAHVPFHPEGQQQRVGVLTLRGASSISAASAYADWDLRALREPYDGVHDLARTFNIGPINNNASEVEFISTAVSTVDLQSKAVGREATPAILLSKDLEPHKARLGYRIVLGGRTVTRGSVEGKRLHWEELPGCLRGSAQFEIPEGALVHCFASYNGTATHHYYIGDPSTAPNWRRIVFGSSGASGVEAQFALLTELLHKSGTNGRDARELETGVAWLAWMHGFGVLHLGATERAQNSVDLILNTPSGNLVVAECTTGMLKSDKIALLVARANGTGEALRASGHSHLKIISLMVTTKRRYEVQFDAAGARRQGVIVLTLEDIEEALQRTIVPIDPEQTYRQWEQQLIDAQAAARN